MKVAILGASDKPERYAHKAMLRLEDHGHETFLVHPQLKEIGVRPVHPDLAALPEGIHTLAMYVNPRVSTDLVDDILKLSPKRVIFNPGAENRPIYSRLMDAGIHVEEACVLVLLSTDQFEDLK